MEESEKQQLEEPLLQASQQDDNTQPAAAGQQSSSQNGHADGAIVTDGDVEQQKVRAAVHQNMDVHFSEVFKTWVAQGSMAWPLLLQLMSTYSLSIISLSFVGHVGKEELAAAGLATSFNSVLGRMILMGLNGAMDTLASQAYGAGDLAALPTLYYRAVLFLWLHALPLTPLLLIVPQVLANKADSVELAHMAFQYLCFLVPNLWLECIARPLNSVLVAQRITQPQMTVALLVVPAHIGTNYLFIHVLKFGYLGAAMATVCATIYSLTFMTIYLALTGMLHRVWGPFSTNVFKGWRQYASMAYPACFMRCAESLGFSLVTLISGLLPDPQTAVAAANVAFNIYGILYMAFAACGMTTIAFVGNALGTGDACAAKRSALSSVLLGPVLWLFIGGALLEPHTQRALALMFTDGQDPVFMHHLLQLLYIVALLELFDGTQTIMSGIITGCGKQKHGALINFVAFYLLAIPVAMLLGFWAQLGVEGMYWGMSLGPATQMIWYGSVVLRTDWQKEASKAQARVAATRR